MVLDGDALRATLTGQEERRAIGDERAAGCECASEEGRERVLERTRGRELQELTREAREEVRGDVRRADAVIEGKKR